MAESCFDLDEEGQNEYWADRMKHSLELKDYLDPESGSFLTIANEQQRLSRIMSTVYFGFAPIVPKYNLAKSTYE